MAECEALEKLWDASPRGFKSLSLRCSEAPFASRLPSSAGGAAIIRPPDDMSTRLAAPVACRVSRWRQVATLRGSRLTSALAPGTSTFHPESRCRRCEVRTVCPAAKR